MKDSTPLSFKPLNATPSVRWHVGFVALTIAAFWVGDYQERPVILLFACALFVFAWAATLSFKSRLFARRFRNGLAADTLAKMIDRPIEYIEIEPQFDGWRITTLGMAYADNSLYLMTHGNVKKVPVDKILGWSAEVAHIDSKAAEHAPSAQTFGKGRVMRNSVFALRLDDPHLPVWYAIPDDPRLPVRWATFLSTTLGDERESAAATFKRRMKTMSIARPKTNTSHRAPSK